MFKDFGSFLNNQNAYALHENHQLVNGRRREDIMYSGATKAAPKNNRTKWYDVYLKLPS